MVWKRNELEFRDGSGRTRLQRAVMEGDREEVRRLLADGADPESRLRTPDSRWRPLLTRLRLLPRRDASFSSSPLLLAVNEDRVELVGLLLEAGARTSPAVLQRAVEMGASADCVRLLLDHGTPVAVFPGRESEALRGALRHRRTDLVRLLLERGADPNADPELWGSALSRCELVADSSGGWRVASSVDPLLLENVRLLLARGARTDRRAGGLDLLPFDRARWGCPFGELAAPFEGAGHVESDGPDGRLRAAVGSGDLELARSALAAGADPGQRLLVGMTLVRAAELRNRPAVARLLREALSARASSRAPAGAVAGGVP